MQSLGKLLIVVLSVLSMGVSESAPASQSTTDLPETLAAIRPLEVRMRRLHRVRPDLMHYPIQYDILC